MEDKKIIEELSKDKVLYEKVVKLAKFIDIDKLPPITERVNRGISIIAKAENTMFDILENMFLKQDITKMSPVELNNVLLAIDIFMKVTQDNDRRQLMNERTINEAIKAHEKEQEKKN